MITRNSQQEAVRAITVSVLLVMLYVDHPSGFKDNTTSDKINENVNEEALTKE
jgi:hypothetical protein